VGHAGGGEDREQRASEHYHPVARDRRAARAADGVLRLRVRRSRPARLAGGGDARRADRDAGRRGARGRRDRARRGDRGVEGARTPSYVVRRYVVRGYVLLTT